MSDWSDDRTTIKAAVDGLAGYIIIPENEDPEDSPATHSHKAYSLRFDGHYDSTMHTNSAMVYVRTVILKVIYIVKDDTQLVIAEGLFDTLVNTITALTGFINHNTEPKPELADNQHLLGTLDFQFGVGINS